jgi:hypothetical protein
MWLRWLRVSSVTPKRVLTTTTKGASMNIRSIMSILPELRQGQTITEISAALHDALASVAEHKKDAKVTVTFTVSPTSKAHLKEAAIFIRADVDSKLPEVTEETLFFVDGDGNPTRNAPEAQQQDIFRVAPSAAPNAGN